MANANEQKNSVSRRNFIRNTGIAGAGFWIVPRHVLGGKGFIAPSDKLRIASVGVGGKGGDDIAHFARSGKADMVFLCDVDDRRAADSVKNFPKAKYYKDWRKLFDEQSKNFDAVSVSTPDHNHAIITLNAMQLGKHVYVQKPLTHDLYEARTLTNAAKKYKVVTQMGNQGSSNDDARKMREWYEAGLIGDVHEVWSWTNRPVWPQGIPWPADKPSVPKELDWDLWLGTAPYKDYVDKLVPFNWRGWWDYGTGALGDMGCHLMEAPFTTLGLEYASEVQCSVGSVYVDEFKQGYFPDGCPPSSHVTLKFPKTGRMKNDVVVHWMDGGIQPTRPEELGANDVFGDGGNGTLFIGTKGKMVCDTYNENARLLPLSRNADVHVAQKYKRVPGQAEGHYAQWIEASIAGYGNMEVSSPFEKAGPLVEALLMANLAIRGFDVQRIVKDKNGKDKTSFPARYVKLLWDNEAMKVTNIDDVNQFVKRTYRDGWGSLNL